MSDGINPTKSPAIANRQSGDINIGRPLKCGLSVCLVLAFLYGGARVLASGNNGTATEVWFSVRTDGLPGSGTATDPYNGSGNFLSSTVSGWAIGNSNAMVIHLFPGVYQTGQYGLELPMNSSLIGSGISNSIAQQTGFTNALEAYSTVYTIGGSYIQVKDLTIDANYAHNSNAGKGGCLYLGSAQEATVQRVRFINYGSTNAAAFTSEAFAVNWMMPVGVPGRLIFTDNIFDGPTLGSGYASLLVVANNSLSSTPAQDYTNITISIKNNLFMNNGNAFGINLAAVNAVVEGNIFKNIGRAVYLDTGYSANCVIRNNDGFSVGAGVTINNGYNTNYGTSNWIVENNIFRLNDTWTTDTNFPPCGFRIRDGATNCIFRGNQVLVDPAFVGTTKTNWYGFYLDSHYDNVTYNQWVCEDAGIEITDNIVGPELNNVVDSVGLLQLGYIQAIGGNRVAGTTTIPQGFPYTIFLQSVTTNDVVIPASFLNKGINNIWVEYNWSYGSHQGIVIPPPSACLNCPLEFTIFKSGYYSQPIPLKIAGVNGFSTAETIDPTGGGYFSPMDYPNMFFIPEDRNAFATNVNVFVSSGATNRMARVKLNSNGYQWIVQRSH